MPAAPVPPDEDQRIAALEGLSVLSTPREADLDRVTRSARHVMKSDIALLTLVDRDRQWFKSRQGLDMTETERSHSFCAHAILDAGTLVVPDAREDARFADNPLVVGAPHVRFYVGHPLATEDGHRIGTLCVISSTPRQPDEESLEIFRDLARMAEIILENRKLSETQKALMDSLTAAERDKMIDPLTGVWNRRGLEELAGKEIARARRDGKPLLVGVCDVDHFKKINDSFGHKTGDDAIRLTAQLLVETCRTTDVVARFGGEEFVVIVPGAGADGAAAVGDKLLRAFRDRAVVRMDGASHRFTVSIGFALFDPSTMADAPFADLLEKADRALYEAKAGGRDRCCMAPA